jgi:hypothetical protein
MWSTNPSVHELAWSRAFTKPRPLGAGSLLEPPKAAQVRAQYQHPEGMSKLICSYVLDQTHLQFCLPKVYTVQ